MASKQGVKSRGFGFNSSKAANSYSSSTTSSSKQFPETSADGLSSPALSSARRKPPHEHFYFETVPLDAQRAKENVTVIVRFRPLKYNICIWGNKQWEDSYNAWGSKISWNYSSCCEGCF